jgi:drug/metabolite transporter (DMT)-like permease
MIGGHTLINYILKDIKASVATSIALAEPIGASLLASLFLNQQLDWPKIVVMVIVIVSIVLTISQEIIKPSES